VRLGPETGEACTPPAWLLVVYRFANDKHVANV
jgi:hypothetical protein